MSDTVTLTASPSGAQSATVTASVIVNDAPSTTEVNFTTADPTIATVTQTGAQTGNVTGVRDPSGTGSKTVVITGTTADGSSGTATATVTTIGDTVVVTLDFGTPTP